MLKTFCRIAIRTDHLVGIRHLHRPCHRGKSVIFKIPPGKLADALEQFSTSGVVIEKTIAREDLTHQIAQ